MSLEGRTLPMGHVTGAPMQHKHVALISVVEAPDSRSAIP